MKTDLLMEGCALSRPISRLSIFRTTRRSSLQFAFLNWTLGVERFLHDSPTFHADAEARLVACEGRQKMRQQLIASELADYAGRCRLRPALGLFEIAPCPAAFGFDLDYVVSVHVTTSAS